MQINVNLNSDDSSKRYNKFWKQSISEGTTTEEDSSSGNSSNHGNTAIITGIPSLKQRDFKLNLYII